MKLVSLADVKTFLEITATSFDALLTMIIQNASASVETYLNRNLEKIERVAYYNAGKRYIYLPAYPIDSTTQLIVEFCDSIQTKDVDFFVRNDVGLIEFPEFSVPLYMNPNELEITWTGGYAEIGATDDKYLDVPLNIRDATMIQVAYTFRRRKDIGVASVSLPDGSISKNPIDNRLLPEVRSSLSAFRRVVGEV